MRVVFFASGGPGNLQSALDAEALSECRLRVDLVVCDRPGIPAIELAKRYGRDCRLFDFHSYCGPVPKPNCPEETRARYVRRRRSLHTRILGVIREVEAASGCRFDLAVLAYRRVIEGPLLEYFSGRMINQHPADLAELGPCGQRLFRGIGGHARALRMGRNRSRTSTILVRREVDGGEILAQGPWVEFSGSCVSKSDVARHEEDQKHNSDRPALMFVLDGISKGRFRICDARRHPAGGRVVSYDGTDIPYHGVQLVRDAERREVCSDRRD